MNKMTKLEQQKLVVDFTIINNLSQTMLVQDITNTKALNEDDEPNLINTCIRLMS